MNLKTFRARTMQEALALVRSELGTKASVLHTRQVRAGGLLSWLGGSRMVEVVATTGISVPSRLPRRETVESSASVAPSRAPSAPLATPLASPAPHPLAPSKASIHGEDLHAQLSRLQSRVDDLCRRTLSAPAAQLPEAWFRLFTDLIDADIQEDLARELVERVRQTTSEADCPDGSQLKESLARLVESEIRVSGPIRVQPGRRHLVALVGPTGVGKTTTIAKLAANYRLRDKRRVGLITVDTYRIAAVEQLRTYADIIDLPMEIVATPREMHQALARMADLDLVLMDTAGRSPRDDVKIQELKSMLAEAAPD